METSKNCSWVDSTRCCEASGAGVATGGCSRDRLASPVTCHSRRFESKAHGAQRQRHINEIGDERAPCNAAIESRSRFLEISKC